MAGIGPPTERTRVRRLPERGVYDRATIHAIVDEALVCHLAWVTDEGRPRVIPTVHARVGDTLYVHGSTSSRALRAIADGREVCVEITLVDGLVLARSAFHHSMNYRSVVIYGTAREVAEAAEREAAQRALVERVGPGRAEHVRMANDRELAQTSIFAIGMTEASAKVRAGPPKDAEQDVGLDVWAGVLPLRTVLGEPEPAPDLEPGTPVPGYLRDDRR